tara:strand:+ start:1223 stop:1711 length:489 start_codon:yes stop_codon:yes gene_type:complete
MNSKLTRTLLMIGTLLMPLILWWTRDVDLKSMSAYANANNNFYYHAMHTLGSWFFILNGTAKRRNLYYWVGFGMGGILITNMYVVQTVHNVVTAITMGLAVASMIWYSSKKNMVSNIFMSALAVGVFVLGFLVDSVHLFFAEWFAMFIIAVHMVKKVHLDEE